MNLNQLKELAQKKKGRDVPCDALESALEILGQASKATCFEAITQEVGMNIEQRIKEIKWRLNQYVLSPSFWTEGNQYYDGDLVLVDDKVYICLMQNSDYPPDSDDWVKKDCYDAIFLREACYLKESYKVIKELQSEVERYKSLDEWRPIETAPRDNKSVLLYCNETESHNRDGKIIDGGVFVGYCHHNIWWYKYNGKTCHPTHWKPLPKPPKQNY